MRRISKLFMLTSALMGLALASLPARAQDFPTLKGNNSRVGRNAAPLASGPGRSFLRWWRPNLFDNVGSTTIVDNTDLPNVLATGLWGQPLSVTEEAFNPFIVTDPVGNELLPNYRFAYTTNALSQADPTVPANAANHRTWSWTINPGGIARNYALYVWLPVGPTIDVGVTRFQARFFVYEIFYGTGQRWIEVVDSYAGGTGWIRLGNGGRPTTQLFPFDGVAPIRVVLHNTIPLDDFGRPFDRENETLVYADAVMAIPDIGFYTASPTVSEFQPGGPVNTHVIAAINQFELGTRNGEPATITKGVVKSLEFDSASGADNTRWEFVPRDESPDLVVHQDNSSAGVTVGLGWSAVTLFPNFRGTDYLVNVVTNVLAGATDVIFDPTLEEGSYDVWAWCPGSGGSLAFANAQMWEVVEGPTVTQVTADMESGGWVRLGTRKFNHRPAIGEPLRVRATNFSALGSDLGREAYVDAVRFVGAADTSVHSTPVQTRAFVRLDPINPPVETDVTIVAAENGKIYCLRSSGNTATRTTDVIWSYPSTPDPDNAGWTDPNQVAGEDGPGGIAEMPSGFDLSSALVERIGGIDYLFIGTSNGRVYCIEMEGRGDMDFGRRVPGTTRRRWSYPDDYPSAPRTSLLGPIRGSVAFVTNAAGPTLLVPTVQGRMYALDALGNAVAKTTTQRWVFPALTAPTLGSIEMTPSIEFGNVYFGTRSRDDGLGLFFALNQDTGAVVGAFDGTSVLIPMGDFTSGPITIPATEMAGMPDTVVVANDNGFITALNSDLSAVQWITDELGSSVLGNLTYTPQTVFDTTGAYFATPVPCVVVPTADGRIMSLFAETARTDFFGTRTAWGFNTAAGEMQSSVAVGRNWMYAADKSGYLYAFNDNPAAISPGTPPGQQVIVPNDPRGIPFRNAKLRFIDRKMYESLRLTPPSAIYPAISNPANHLPDGEAFEWGETMYLLMYDFPLDPGGGQAPQVEFRINLQGVSVRNLTVRARSIPGGSDPLDAYAVVSFTFQGSGSTAVPPGAGRASATISASFSPGAPLQNVMLNPANVNRTFAVANPISIAVGFLPNGLPSPDFHIAYTPIANDPEALVNGSPDVASTAKRENLLLASAGIVPHNQQGQKLMAVIDRSLMTFLRGPERGLDNIRLDRANLAWQGGSAAIFKPIDLLAYPGFEDRPDNFPNDSIDYPNEHRDRITVIKDRFGNAENPVFNAVSLTPPVVPDPSLPDARTLRLTPFDIEINVPRFQPANLFQIQNSSSVVAFEPAGYYGRMHVFVDSNGDGQLTRSGRREAIRSFWAGNAVAPDEKMAVGTPTVDLGSLPHGMGYTLGANPFPWNQPGSPYSPWAGPFASTFRPFVVRNEGNVNQRDVRVAKSIREGIATPYPWGIFAPANHERSWLDTEWHLWSDIDATFAPTPRVLFQKSRVDDRAPTELSPNPLRRANANLGVLDGFLLNTAVFPPGAPRVSVSLPIGFPVGTYASQMRVIEDNNQDQALQYDLLPGGVLQPTEPFSDPGFVLRFTSREARATNSNTRLAPPMVHDLIAGGENFLHQNIQPTGLRDPNGNLMVAFGSNSAAFNTPQPGSESLNDQWRIYLATLGGVDPTVGPTVGTSVLRDLNAFGPSAAGQYYRQDVGPYPAGPFEPMFGVVAPDTLIGPTVKFAAPAVPLLGMYNPYPPGANHGRSFMTFLGEAQVQTPTGRRGESQVFVAQFTMAPNGALSLNAPGSLGRAEGGATGKPAIVATSDDTGTVFFGAGGSGQSQVRYMSFQYVGGSSYSVGATNVVPTGLGFETAHSPSVHARSYLGAAAPGLSPGDAIMELAFAGKLRGRPHPEIFFARLLAGGTNGGPRIVPGTRSPVLLLPEQIDDRLSAEAEAGVFRSRGVGWNLSSQIVLTQLLNGAVTNLEVPNTRVIERTSGMISFDSTLGGKAYLDPSLGTVRFAGAVPSRTAVLQLTYTPRFVRISSGIGAGYGSPTGLFDNRRIGEFSYWARFDNTPLVPAGGPIPDDDVRSGRYVFTYGRTAAGAGQSSRPYMKTYRLGAQLLDNFGRPIGVHTQANGAVTSMNVVGATSYYQIDPANGRVYFTADDENRIVTVNFTGVDEATGQQVVVAARSYRVSMLAERSENPVAIEQAVNETQLWTFVDPFDNQLANLRRPGLLWMFYTSTRGGTSDVFFQTVAPRFTPVPVGRG